MIFISMQCRFYWEDVDTIFFLLKKIIEKEIRDRYDQLKWIHLRLCFWGFFSLKGMGGVLNGFLFFFCIDSVYWQFFLWWFNLWGMVKTRIEFLEKGYKKPNNTVLMVHGACNSRSLDLTACWIVSKAQWIIWLEVVDNIPA